MVIRLAPSQAGGKLLFGISMGGGGAWTSGTGVPSLFKTNLSNPAVTVPQVEGVMPGRGVIVQQVTRPRTRKKVPRARSNPTTMKMICAIEGRRNLMSLKKFMLFMQV